MRLSFRLHKNMVGDKMKDLNKKKYFGLEIALVSYGQDVVTLSPAKDEKNFATDVYDSDWFNTGA